MKKKILITGANGMLGTAISSRLKNHHLFAYSSNELDITCTHKVHELVSQVQPDYIINCAAYTAVDKAEDEKEKAYKINATAVEKLAQIAAQFNATLIHFSTDYVFDGMATQPYRTSDATNPINVYGASKLAGEKAIQANSSKYYIFRTSWLYADYGKNFFNWLATKDQQDLNIVSTQVGSPTSALSLADFIHHLIENDPYEYGTYHYVNKGELSWYDFAIMINEKLDLHKRIRAVDDFPSLAERPSYSVMKSDDIQSVFRFTISTVEEALDEVILCFRESET